MKTKVEALCDEIISAAMSVHTRGCDDVAMSNLAQLRGICQAAAQIKEIVKGEDKNHA